MVFHCYTRHEVETLMGKYGEDARRELERSRMGELLLAMILIAVVELIGIVCSIVALLKFCLH